MRGGSSGYFLFLRVLPVSLPPVKKSILLQQRALLKEPNKKCAREVCVRKKSHEAMDRLSFLSLLLLLLAATTTFCQGIE